MYRHVPTLGRKNIRTLLVVLVFTFLVSVFVFNPNAGFAHEYDYCPRFRIGTHQMGRLGNLMGSYATLWAVANHTKYQPYVYPQMLSQLQSAFSGLTLTSSCIPSASAPRAELNLRGPDHVYQTFVDRHVGKTEVIFLAWFPFAPHVFHAFNDQIRHQFVFNDGIRNDTGRFFRYIRSRSSVSSSALLVSVHVRRDDYSRHLPKLVSVDFFARAVDALTHSLAKSNINSQLVLIVTTDDLSWCRKNLPMLNKTMFIASDFWVKLRHSSPAHFDLAVAASCDHAIFDYGTFGFWGAYLAGGHAVAGDDVGIISYWDVQAMKRANIPNWTFIPAFVNSSSMQA